jgi:hypothetical protein
MRQNGSPEHWPLYWDWCLPIKLVNVALIMSQSRQRHNIAKEQNDTIYHDLRTAECNVAA